MYSAFKKYSVRIIPVSLGLAVAILLVSGLSCADKKSPLAPSVNPENLTMLVDGFVASFDKNNNTVVLSWEKPGFDFDFYKIYRAPADSTGLDTSLLASTGIRRVVSKDKTTFADILDLPNSIFWYGIQAVKVFPRNADVADTVQGVLSDLDSVLVGSEISFNINRADVFIVTRNCTLFVNDYLSKIKGVRFTQKADTYLKNTSNGDLIPANDFFTPQSPVTNDRLLALLGDSVNPSFLSLTGKLTDTSEFVTIPDFNYADPENDNSPAYSPAPQNAFAWTLQKGNGEKRVYAELDFGDHKDTLSDGIQIQPYRIRLSLRNNMVSNDRTMRQGSMKDARTKRSIPVYYLYKPRLEFITSIFADTTVDETFYVWTLLQKDGNAFNFDPLNFLNNVDRIDPQYPWIETNPKKYTLTGRGPAHDDENVYNYYLDSADGSENLSPLRVTREAPQHKGRELAMTLDGAEVFNEIAVPGSYYGPDPWRYNEGVVKGDLETGDDSLMYRVQYTLEGPASQMYKTLFHLRRSIEKEGLKEFMIMGWFKGKFFEDTRMVIANYAEDGTYLYRTFFDLFQPEINLYPNDYTDRNPSWVTNDCTIVGMFNYALSNSSVFDRGGADVSTIKLIIAKKPDDMEWVLRQSQDSIATPDTLSISSMYTWRHRVFPFEIKAELNYINGVRWDNIDPTNWPSGNYIMGIVTGDEYGNEGWGFGELRSRGYTNPWMVHIASGK